MKPFIVLALCCSFFSSRANPLPFEFLDCDDPDVFKAVDTALKKYNGDRATDNQFALYMVMEAKRTAGLDTQFHVKYRIQETICATEENKLWQDCDYKVSTEAKTGECTAQVHMNNTEETSNVLQNCKIFPVTPKITVAKATCLGCFHPISSDSLEVSEILKQAIQKFNRHSNEPALFKLVEIKEAKIQVVAGWNYIIKYDIEETNCSKDQFQDLTPECKITSRGHIGKCDAKAFENLHGQMVDIESQCKFPAEDKGIHDACSGCPTTIPKDSPELKELLKVSMEKYNAESNDDFYYKVGEIETATVQVVAGEIYRIQFAVQKTNCSKKEFKKLHEDCEATSGSAPLLCEAHIYVIPWENKTFPQVNCSIERSMQLVTSKAVSPQGETVDNTVITEIQKQQGVFLRRPAGFTPFRSFATLQQPRSHTNKEERQRPGEETRQDDGQETEGEGEPEHKHGHKHRHKYGHKHKHRYRKDHESDTRHRHEIGCRHRTGHGCGHKSHSKNGKHKHPNPKSSEESNERVFNRNETLPSSSAETAPELVNPGVARKEISTPAEPLILPHTSLLNGLPDRPESPPPRCPGKPWKQIMDLPAPPTFPREFTNEDLLLSTVENINPATETSTPPQNKEKDLDLSDALQ